MALDLDIIIKNGTVVTSNDTYVADIGIKDEKIVLLDKELVANNAEIIDASGKYVFPGGVDVHTHLDMPLSSGLVSKDDFKTGTVAAACGGTTTIIDFATQEKRQSLQDTVAVWHAKAKGKAVIDYGFHIAITDVNENVLQEIPEVIKQGYSSFKLYMTYDPLRVNEDDFMKVLLQTRDHGGLVCVHAENHFIIKYFLDKFKREGKTTPFYHPLSRPPLVEAEAVGRAIKLAALTDASLYVVHLTCKQALDEVVRARENNLKIMAETCPQYLLLSDERYSEPDFNSAKYVISPPLRSKDNQEFLWQALAQNQLQVVSTDHCSFDFKGQKERGRDFFANIPGGIAGIETRIPLLYEYGVNKGKISLNRFVALTATNPAKIFGLYPRKGAIAVGSDADLVVFDPQLKQKITQSALHQNVDYTPYEGFEVTGYPVTTLSRGKVIVKGGQFVGKTGAGKFIAREHTNFM
jgi:dihydropyrimidinase